MSSNLISDQSHKAIVTSSRNSDINSNLIDLESIKNHQQNLQNNKIGTPNNNYKNLMKKGSVTDDLDKLKQRREERKKKFDDDKKTKNDKNIILNDGIIRVDLDYENLIKRHKNILYKVKIEQHLTSDNWKILVCVRKRPIFKKESASGEIDCVSSVNPRLFVHECKMKIDGITKYIEDYEFIFDNVFGEEETTEDLYSFSVEPTINLIMNGGIVTCFAYGQTGSGKTFTMKGIQNLAIESLFEMNKKLNKNFDFYVSFFEIYAGRLYDLLNNKNKLSVLEDKHQKVQIFGLEEKIVFSVEEMSNIIDLANSIRTTHNTVTNEVSSRSHAICNIIIKERDCEEAYGKLILVDLAGSERAQETQSNDKNRRVEGAEINKSLLALKECIRALDTRKNGNSDAHVPFRASKLTLVLRDSFIPKFDKAKIIMIACVSPGISSANHTINTLRYSDRLKEKSSTMKLGDLNLLNENMNLKISNDLSNNKFDEYEIEDSLQKLDLNPIPITKNSFSNVYEQKNKIQEHKIVSQYYKNIIPEPKNIIQEFKSLAQEATNPVQEFKSIAQEQKSRTPIQKKIKLIKKKSAPDEWEYLKKSQESKEEKYDTSRSQEFKKYREVKEKSQINEDFVINSHMRIIKENAKLLTQEGELISNIKGVGSENFNMDEYTKSLDEIISKKISIYSELKRYITIYKNKLK